MFERTADICVSFGCKHLNMTVPYTAGHGMKPNEFRSPSEKFSLKLPEDYNWEMDWAVYVESMRSCVKIAKERCLMLSIECFPYTICSSPHAWLALLDELEYPISFGVQHDTAHLANQRHDPVTVIHMVGKYIVNVHCKDSDMMTRGNLPAGCGTVDYVAVLKTLKRLDIREDCPSRLNVQMTQFSMSEVLRNILKSVSINVGRNESMQLGMISCCFMAGIYDYKVPNDFNWKSMVDKHHEEFGEKEFVTMLSDVKAVGLDVLELWAPHASYLFRDEKDAHQYKRLMDDNGIFCPVYCIGGWRKVDLPVIERGFAFAKALGCKVINGVVANDPEDHEPVLTKIDQIGKQYGIRYSIENHAIPSMEDYMTVRAVCDSHTEVIGANIDVGIYYCTGYDVLKATEVMKERVYHVHFKDSIMGRAGSVPSGDGEATMKELATYLKSIDYKGMISLEWEPRFDPRPDLARAVTYCRSIV